MSLNKYMVSLLLIFLVACNQESDTYQLIYDRYPESPVADIEVLDSHFITLQPHDYNLIINEDTTVAEIGMVSIIELTDHLLAIANDRRTIRKIHPTTGEIINRFRYYGDGPGEYRLITELRYDGDLIYTFDRQNYKVLTYTPDMQPVQEYILSDFNPFIGNGFDVADAHLIYRSNAHDDMLFVRRNLSSDAILARYHRNIIPLGMEPRIYNNHLVAATDSAFIFLQGTLPFLFIYNANGVQDKAAPDKILRLKHPAFEILEDDIDIIPGTVSITNPPLQPRTASAGIFYGSSPVFQDITANDRWIFMQQTTDNRLLVLYNTDEGYELIGSFVVHDENDEPIRWNTVTTGKYHIYLGGYTSNTIIQIPYTTFRP